MFSELLLLRHRSRSPSEANSFLHNPFPCILFAIVLCICLLTLTFLMRTFWEMKWTTKQNVKIKDNPGFPRKAMQHCARNAPQPQRCVTSCPLHIWVPVITRPFVYAFMFSPHIGMLKEAWLPLSYWGKVKRLWLMFKYPAVWGLHWDGLRPAQRWGSEQICQTEPTSIGNTSPIAVGDITSYGTALQVSLLCVISLYERFG